MKKLTYRLRSSDGSVANEYFFSDARMAEWIAENADRVEVVAIQQHEWAKPEPQLQQSQWPWWCEANAVEPT